MGIDEMDREHLRKLRALERKIERIYAAALGKVARAVALHGEPGEGFSFGAHPVMKRSLERALRALAAGVEKTVTDGIGEAWELSREKGEELEEAFREVLSQSDEVRGGDTGTSSLRPQHSVDSGNEASGSSPFGAQGAGRGVTAEGELGSRARERFVERRTKGLGLSERVWGDAERFGRDIETALELGIGKGESASSMARTLKRWLEEPDKLFRRVRDERGVLHLSKRAADYHPGRGVYRSSYRNARRLAVTEVNMAYHAADRERWMGLDFVIGIEVKLSSNHTVEGKDGKLVRLTDICDELAGKYPKDFHFTGWHPHCRCVAVPILRKPGETSGGEVTDVPEGFRKWVEGHEDKIAGWREKGNEPYFLRENRGRVDGVLKGKTGDDSAGDVKAEKKAEKPISNTLGEMTTSMREKKRIERNRQLYEDLLRNPDYYDVRFNPENGGLMATHKGHIFDPRDGHWEKEVQNIGFTGGYSVILGDENSNILGKKHIEGLWNDLKFELATRETATENNILRGLKHCADKIETEVAILYFPNDNFDENKFKNALRRYRSINQLPDRTYVEFKKIICIGTGGIILDVKY